MKKLTLAALIIGGFAAQAQAQSNVTIYGLVDAGIVSERGGVNGSVTKVTSGIGGQSRLGFRGTEDLGNGLSAIFQMETGFKADDGSLDTANSIFNRQAFVGLKSKDAGQLTIGRQYTMLYNAQSQVADPFGAGYAGTIKNLFPSAGANTRVSNAIVYATPTMGGFSAEALYALGEQAGSATAGRQFGFGLNYAQGPLNARLVYNNKNNDTAAVGTTPAKAQDTGRNTMFAANYDFKVIKAYFAYSADKGVNSAQIPVANAYGFAVAPKASTDSNDILIGAQIPAGNGYFMTSYIRKDDKTANNQDANQFALGYLYSLSKRTGAYVSYAKIKNKNGAGYTVGNNNEAGSGDKAFNVGIRHAF
ncbi:MULTISPECIES: porin [unclassified Duganella]|uniref:porin n=1 Tax=unclassified Duganella TaxID=2636909 RepID=UPI000884FDE2|nr:MULTISPECIES: porin [unclassified Duganella]SDH38783.1 Outer membrane protein (porin) [Duganella sp. OV458]SDK74263.1 Outer membrane protein (porin) [Duganella sp. OV510]